MVATHIVVLFQIILFPFGEKVRHVLFHLTLVCSHFVLTAGCLSSEWNFPLLIGESVMWLCPRCEQGCPPPCCCIKTAVFHITVQLDKVRTPGRDTLNVSVPLPDSRFKTLSFHLSLLQLCGRTVCRMHVCLMCTSWMVSMAARYLTSQCVENWVCSLVNIHHWSQREYWTLIWFWRLMLYQR